MDAAPAADLRPIADVADGVAAQVATRPEPGPALLHARRHQGAVNFDMVLEHYLEAYPDPPLRHDTAEAKEDREAGFRLMLDRFKAVHGEVISQCWCSRVGAGALLTSRRHRSRLRRALSGDEVRYFAGGETVDTKEDLVLGKLMRATDREAQRVADLLRNPMRANALGQLFSVRETAIQAFEEIAKHDLKGDAAARVRDIATELVTTDLAAATSYAEGAMHRRSQLLYLAGMAAGAAGLAVLTAALLWFFGRQPALMSGTEMIPIAILLGGLGGVVSVLQRMTKGNLTTSLDNGQAACFLLGLSRPVIGSVLAFAIALLILGGVVPLELPSEPAKALFFIAGIAFLAGFSERYAQDIIGGASKEPETDGQAPSEG